MLVRGFQPAIGQQTIQVKDLKTVRSGCKPFTSEIVQCAEAVSIKSTKVTDLQQWMTTYRNHLNDLRDNMGINGAGFTGKSKTIKYDKAKVIIAVPEYNLSTVSAWKAALKINYPTLDFEVIKAEDLL